MSSKMWIVGSRVVLQLTVNRSQKKSASTINPKLNAYNQTNSPTNQWDHEMETTHISITT